MLLTIVDKVDLRATLISFMSYVLNCYSVLKSDEILNKATISLNFNLSAKVFSW